MASLRTWIETVDFYQDRPFGGKLALQRIAEHAEPIVMQVFSKGHGSSHRPKINVFHGDSVIASGKMAGFLLDEIFPLIGDLFV